MVNKPSQKSKQICRERVQLLSQDDIVDKAREAMLMQFGRQLTPEAENWLRVKNWRGGVNAVIKENEI